MAFRTGRTRSYFFLSLLSWLLATASLPAAADSPPCGGVFPAVADASVVEAAPGDNFGTEPELRVENPGDGTMVWRTLIGFDLGDRLPPGATVDRAWLRLTGTGAAPVPFGMEVRAVTSAWKEATVTWLKQPVYGPAYALPAVGTESGDVLVDVTTLVTHWSTGRLENRSLALFSRPPALARFLSREGGSEGAPGPELLVKCRLVPERGPGDASEGDARQVAAIERLRGSSLDPLEIRLVRGAVAAASFRLVVPAAVRLDPLTRARWFLAEYADLLRAGDPGSAWQLRRRSEDGRHLVFRQVHNRIPVFPGELIVHLDGEDVVGLSGAYAADLDPALGVLAPPIDAARARALAQADAGEGSQAVGDIQAAIVDGRLLGTPGAAPRLAWTAPIGGPVPGLYAIDATTGRTLHLEDAIQEAFDLTLRTAQNTDPPADAIGCWFWNGSDEEWFDETGQTRFTPPLPDQEGTDAFGHISAVDAYWRSTFARDGHNGSGGQEGLYLDVIIRNLLNQPSNNAYFAPYCNDFRFATGMATLDVIGHEYTHGVVANEANLRYENQSGALNESYADLFGYFVDPGDWTLGEGSAGGVFRDLSNPPRFGQPDHMDPARSGDGCGLRPPTLLSTSPCWPRSFDNGFVHTNSGIPNKAGYLLIHGGTHGGYSVTGLGIPKVQRLLHETLANRLVSSSQLIDQRDQMIAAAAADPTLTPFARCQVRNAYAAVGLGIGDANCDGVPDDLSTDDDGDFIPDGSDNCPQLRNPSQADQDSDGTGNGCDIDVDGDGRLNAGDNCPLTENPSQEDTDDDGIGEACDDEDGDGVPNAVDGCPLVSDPDQTDTNGNGITDACSIDDDDDGVVDVFDNCPTIVNRFQTNADGDERGDACDNCPAVPSSSQADADGDGIGNPCDDDRDNDGVSDGVDNCPSDPNPGQSDFDEDGVGNACDPPEQRRIYEDIRFFELERNVIWPLSLDLPIEIGVPVCPACGGEAFPPGFRPELTVRMTTPFVAILRDEGTGHALAVTREPALEHHLQFRPESYAFSRFGFGPFKGGSAGSPGLPAFVGADQRRYAVELYPAPGTDRAATHGVTITHTQCEDADADGVFAGGLEGCPGPSDCDDLDWRRAPGRAEACDGLDNDCDGTVDDDPLAPPGTARVYVRRTGGGGAGASSETWWTEMSDVGGYDLVRGDVAVLRSSGGDFGSAANTCLADDAPGTSITDDSAPKPGEAFFYLVRGVNCAGSGTFDGTGAGQQGSRDGAAACGP